MAANTIKGLTVEIGGDTTKLGKALEDVNKKSKALSSELGDINRLLKMDPGNADLLAQKQSVLAEAVENTAKKLETLKTVESQVQEQFARGDASEEQIRALQREIIGVTSKMEAYKKAAKETADALEELVNSTDAVENGASDIGKKADEAAKNLDDLADSADDVGKSGKGMGAMLGGTAKAGLAAIATAAAAAVTALVGAAESSREYRTEMGKLETAFITAGHSAETAKTTYQTLQGILGNTEQAVEASGHLAKLAENAEDLATWTDIATGVYATFGASLPIENLTEAANETAKTGTLTGGLADALNWAGVAEDEFQASLDACTNEQERQNLIMETLNGLYSTAAEQYREANAEIIRANEANEAWAAVMGTVGEAVEPILTDIKLLGASMVSDLLPGITAVTEGFGELLGGGETAAEKIGEALSGLISSLLEKLSDLAPTVVRIGTELITSLVTTLISMLPELLKTGVQLILTLLEGISQALPDIILTVAEIIPDIVSALADGIPLLLEGALAFFMAIIDAIPLLIDVLVPQIPTIVTTIIACLVDSATALTEGALQLFMAITDAIPMLIEAIVPEIPNIVISISNALIEAAPTLLMAAIELLMAIPQSVPKIVIELVKTVPTILDAIINVMMELPGRLWKIYVDVIAKVIEWSENMAKKSKETGQNFINNVISFVKQLPTKVWAWLSSTIKKVVEFGTIAVEKAKTAAKNIADAIVNGISAIPSKMASIGGDIVRGLWNGISDMTSWIMDKIGSFADSVLDGIKDFFGIHSPSRVFRDEVGKMLSLGLAEGIEANSEEPMDAMKQLSKQVMDEADAMDGLTLERNLRASVQDSPAVPTLDGGLLGKLDAILDAIRAGQILTIDGKRLVGGTYTQMDGALGQRRILAERGAL